MTIAFFVVAIVLAVVFSASCTRFIIGIKNKEKKMKSALWITIMVISIAFLGVALALMPTHADPVAHQIEEGGSGGSDFEKVETIADRLKREEEARKDAVAEAQAAKDEEKRLEEELAAKEAEEAEAVEATATDAQSLYGEGITEEEVRQYEETYYNDIVPSLRMLHTYGVTFADLMNEVQEEPTTSADDDWMAGMADAVAAIQGSFEWVNSVQPPPHLAETHDTALNAANEFQAALESYPDALFTMEAGYFAKTQGHIENGITYADEVDVYLSELVME